MTDAPTYKTEAEAQEAIRHSRTHSTPAERRDILAAAVRAFPDIDLEDLPCDDRIALGYAEVQEAD